MARGTLRPVDDLMLPAVNAAIEVLTLAPEDVAVVRLARRYAAAIDADSDPERPALETYGPKLLLALTALGATPAGRHRLKGGVPSRASSRLEVLRSARR